AFVSLLLGIVLLPESLPDEARETAPMRIGDLNPFRLIGEMGRKPGLGWLLLVLCLFNFAFNGINSTETLFLIEKFAAQPWQAGALLVLAGITVAAAEPVGQPLVGGYGGAAAGPFTAAWPAPGGRAHWSSRSF